MPYFIPSACWREIAPGILSTTRFAGMLLAYGKKYAVYDIGDGTMEWQVRAETSLFYRKYGSYETKADGMILICDDDKRDKIAENIIRQTMWSRKTLSQIENALPPEGVQDVFKLQKAYEITLRLRSQIIGVIYDMKQYSGTVVNDSPKQEIRSNKQMVTLIIPEPLPGMKELTAAVEEHWVTMIHDAIEQESRTGIPKFQKAMVMIEITAARGTENPRVWDTSNRAINLVINNMKGIFFWDDDFEHMAFSVVANWGEIGSTTIRICELSQWENHSF